MKTQTIETWEQNRQNRLKHVRTTNKNETRKTMQTQNTETWKQNDTDARKTMTTTNA